LGRHRILGIAIDPACKSLIVTHYHTATRDSARGSLHRQPW
jgi:hypothetical protein